MADARKLFGNEKRKPFEEWTEAEQQAHAERMQKIIDSFKNSVVLPQQIAERLNEAIKHNLDSSSQWNERIGEMLAPFRDAVSKLLEERPLLPSLKETPFPAIVPAPYANNSAPAVETSQALLELCYQREKDLPEGKALRRFIAFASREILLSGWKPVSDTMIEFFGLDGINPVSVIVDYRQIMILFEMIDAESSGDSVH